MAESEQPDIIPLLRNVCLALRPLASVRKIKITFSSHIKSISFSHQPYEVISSLSGLLSCIISYLPAKNTLAITTNVASSATGKTFQINIYNSGVNLSRVTEITKSCKIPVSIIASPGNETTFVAELPIQIVVERPKGAHELNTNRNKLPVFFEEVHNRLQRYFIRMDNAFEQLHITNHRDSTFIKNLNECIVQNLHNEEFDAAELSKKMAMSRAQLFRKLKRITHKSTGSYIKAIRLQKAKELLETRDLTVSEVAFKTGFKTTSHFTKVFTEKYGICPSVFRKPKDVTNR